MAKKFCDNCGHDKRHHIKKIGKCKICDCKNFIRGPIRASWEKIKK